MNEIDVERISTGWIREYSAPNKDKKPNDREYAYWDILTDFVYANDKHAWPIILHIINNSKDEFVIANVAAGPLESLIAQNGQEYLDKIAVEARQNPKFLYALRGVWQNQTPDDVWAEVQAIIKKYL